MSALKIFTFSLILVFTIKTNSQLFYIDQQYLLPNPDGSIDKPYINISTALENNPNVSNFTFILINHDSSYIFPDSFPNCDISIEPYK